MSLAYPGYRTSSVAHTRVTARARLLLIQAYRMYKLPRFQITARLGYRHIQLTVRSSYRMSGLPHIRVTVRPCYRAVRIPSVVDDV